jgi:LPXTG-motif cell wall-anchored protein
MRTARRAAIAAGLPPSIWASYVVIGDDRVAAPSNGGPQASRAYLIAAGAALILLAGVLFIRRRRPG